MTQPGAAAAAEVCREKRRLTEGLIAAADEIATITQREIALLTHYRRLEEIEQIQREFAQAVRFKASLVEKYRTHLKAHGC